MFRKFHFWCQMFCDNIHRICPRNEGYRIKDVFLRDKYVWCIDVYDLCENEDFEYQLRFHRHHGRTDFVATLFKKDGVSHEVYEFTPELDKQISDFINKKVG